MQSKVSFVPSTTGMPMPSNGMVQNIQEIVRELDIQCQGRSRVLGRREKKDLGRMYERLPPGCVWEFGRKICLDDEKEVAEYLHHLHEWFNGLSKPKTLGSCKAKVNTFLEKGTHRHLGLILLAQAGCPMAKLFLAVKRGIEQHEYDEFQIIEAQFIFEAASLVMMFMIIIGLLYGGKSLREMAITGRVFAGKASRQISSAVNTLAGTQKSVSDMCSNVSDLASKLSETITNVEATYSTVTNWIKSTYGKVKGMIKGAGREIYPFAKLIVLFSLILAAIELVRTAAKFISKQVIDLVASYFHLPASIRRWWGPEAQSKENFMPKFLSGIYEYCFASSPKLFLELLGPLPKVVSIAKALEYVYEKFSHVLSCMIESWTGELQGKTKLENEVIAFKDGVIKFKSLVDTCPVETVYLATTIGEKDRLNAEMIRLKAKVLRAEKLRPVFVGEYNRYSSELTNVTANFMRRMSVGHRRPIPVWLYIYGPRGVGKSRCVEQLLSDVWATVRSWDDRGKEIFKKESFDLSQVYTMPQEDKFWDGYRGQEVMLVDDIFQTRNPDVRNSVATTMIQLCSPTPHALYVATPELKQILFFTSRLIVTTSNMKPEFHSENMGLQDVKALSDRVTIAVEMQDDGSLRLAFDSRLHGNNGDITMDDLVQIVAECIYTRDDESHVDPVARALPRQGIAFRSARISTEKKQEKGKEKEAQAGASLPWWSSCVASLKAREVIAFNKLPPFMMKWVAKISKAVFYPNVGEDDFETWRARPDVQAFCDGYANYAGIAESLGQIYASTKGHDTRPVTPLLMGGIAALGLLAVGLGTLLKMVMPGTAYKKVEAQSPSYDSRAPGNSGRPGKAERKGGHRASHPGRGARAEKATSFWQRGSQSGADVVRAAIQENSQFAEVRVGPLGCSWEDVKDTDPVTNSWVLFLHGRYVMVPNHLLFGNADMGDEEIFVSFVRGESFTFNVRELLSLDQLPGDITVIQVPGLRERRSIVGHFADALPSYGSTEHIVPSMFKTMVTAERASAWEATLHTIPVNSEYGDFETDLTFHGVTNERGMCGTVYVHQPTGKIFGVHMGGSPAAMTAYASQIYKADLAKLVRGPEIVPPMDPAFEETNVQSGLTVLGLVDKTMGTFMPTKTKISRTLFDLDGLPFEESDGVPAMLSPTEVEGVRVSPVANVFGKKLGKQKRLPGAKPLENLSGFLPKSFDRRNVRVISIEEAIFGIEGYLKPMERNTSAGYFFKKMGRSREQLFGPCPKEAGGKVSIDPLLRRLVEQRMQYMREGKVIPVVYEAFLKDEIRPYAKWKEGSTRLVDPMDLVSLITQRMVLGTFIEESMKDPVNAPVALSINPHSSQWGMLLARHRGDGTREVGAGDFGSYDYSVKNEPKRDYVRMVRANHPEPDLAEVAIECNFQGWHICGRLVFVRPWGTASGSLITGHFNCFCNWWIHKSSFLTVYPESEWHKIETSFVGDDSIFSKDKSLTRFGMQVISDFCRTVLAMEYTSPWKNSDMTVDWDSLIFLKRKFVNSPEGVLAPLAEHSMSNMVKWCECDPRDGETMESTLQSLLNEAWHYGPQKFALTAKWAKRECDRLGFNAYLPDWESLLLARRKDYQVGMCVFVGGKEYEGFSPLMQAVVELNRENMKKHGQEAVLYFYAPMHEEIARERSLTFTDEIITFETIEAKAITDPFPPHMRDAIMCFRVMGNWFHQTMSDLLIKYGERDDCLITRVMCHSRWNFAMLRAQQSHKFDPGWVFQPADLAGYQLNGENLSRLCLIKYRSILDIVFRQTLKVCYSDSKRCELEDSWEKACPVNRIRPVNYTTLKELPCICSCGCMVLNAAMENQKNSTVKTAVTADNGVQAVSEQTLTAPATTALYVTPTMTFGDVGQVAEQELGGYAERAHGVGEFEDTQLLERMVEIGKVEWSVDLGTAMIFSADVDQALRQYSRNAAVLALFRMYRADIEVTIKLNTNQFYFGSLMVTLIPGEATGDYTSERAVVDPTIISASNADSVVKTWNWSWPYPWRGLAGPDANSHPVWLYIEQLTYLEAVKDNMPGSITVTVWARFKNIRLAYPYGPSSLEAQSGKPKVAVPKSKSRQHPAQDPLSGLEGAATDVIDAVTSVPATIVDGAVGTLTGLINTGASMLLGGLLDKPDQVEEQTPVVSEQSKDLFAADIPDTNVCFSLNKARYVDPSPNRMPLSKDWTLLDYAKIPGIRYINNGMTAGSPSFSFQIIQPSADFDVLRTPLDYATKCCALYRGSVKVMLMFFASSFVSARVVVQLCRKDGTNDFDLNYDYGLSKVINVKGDTIDYFTVPWLDFAWWTEQDLRWLQIKLVSTIATTDVTLDPRIQCIVWVAAGDDFQFQFPRVPLNTEWSDGSPSIEAQSSIGKMFLDEFPPIVDNIVYDTDNGFATGESLGYMTDIAKRYAPLNLQPIANYNWKSFYSDVLDSHPTYSASDAYAQYVAQRKTFFGAMRECFLFRSGGYRYRTYHVQAGQLHQEAKLVLTAERDLEGTFYCEPHDTTCRITVPQVSTRPFYAFDDSSPDLPVMGMNIHSDVFAAETYIQYLAARDDVQFGFPILPKGVPNPYISSSKKVPTTSILRKATAGIKTTRCLEKPQ